MLVQSPLWRRAVIGIILIHYHNFIIFCLYKRSYMERNTPVFGVNVCNRNNQLIQRFDPFKFCNTNAADNLSIFTNCDKINALLWIAVIIIAQMI